MSRLLSRREACGTLAAASLCAMSARQGEAAVPVRDALESFDYSGVRLLGGMLHNQAQYARQLFLGIPDDSFLHGFRRRAGQPAPGQSLAGWYHDDVWHPFGQCISGMARLSRALGDAEIGNKAKRLVNEWAKTLGPKGYGFYSFPTKTPHYNYDKTMCGLIDVYRYGGFKEAAGLMVAFTDWAMANLDRSRSVPTRPVNAGEWYTLSENLYRAYEATGNAKFRTFGDVWRYPEYWNMFVSGAPPNPYGRHAYSHVNTLCGCAMAYRVTGDRRYLQAIVNAFAWLERTQLFATGGYGPNETLLAPGGALGQSLNAAAATFETACGSWAAFKLGRYLLEFTGQSIYGDWIEKLVYNGIGAALPLQGDGSTFYYSDYIVPGGRKAYHKDKWPCCSGTYIQAIADYVNLIYFREPDALLINLYVPSAVTWNHGGNEVGLELETAYPAADSALITVRTRRPDSFAIKFRVPRWCQGAAAEVNGAPAGIVAQPGTWAAVGRRWNDGDRLKITIPMEPAVHPVDRQHPNRVAFTCGPVVLVGQGNGHAVRRNGDLPRSFARTGTALAFDLEGTSFVAFYQLGLNEPYQMYFDLAG